MSFSKSSGSPLVRSSKSSGSSLAMRVLAIVVLAIAAWVLLKLLIGVVTAIAWTVAVVLALVAIVWAIRVL